MVDLPSVQGTPANVSAPQSRVSPGQVAQPYAELAANLDKAGHTLSKTVAEPLAEQAGFQAVTRDDEGNLVVAKAPIFGDAAIAYHRAAKFSALAESEADAKRKDLELSKQYHNDPDGYLAASDAFRKGVVAQVSKAAGPDVGISLDRSITNATTYNYRWLLLEQQRTIKRAFDANTNAVIKSAETDLYSLIESGGLETEEGRVKYKQLVNTIQENYRERSENPISPHYGQDDVTAAQLKQTGEQIEAAKFSREINNILADPKRGLEAAEAVVEAEKTNKNVSPAQASMNNIAGQKVIKQYQDNLIRSANIDAKRQKMADDMIEDAIIRDRASDSPQITENDIKNNQQMSAAAKMRMLAWVKKDGMPEPQAHVSQVNAMGLFGRINLPDDDPGKMKDLSPIRDAYIKGNLTRADEEWLEKRFIEGRSPEGSRLDKLRAEFTKAVEPTIDKSNPLLGKIDQDGKLQHYAFQRFVDQKVDEYRQGKKNPADLFDPSKPDFLGKPETLKQFQIPLTQSLKKMGEQFRTQPSAPQFRTQEPAAKDQTRVPSRQPGESIVDFDRRMGIK